MSAPKTGYGMNDRAVQIACTIGDPGGIGPEIAAKLIAGGTFPGEARVCFIGSAAALRGSLTGDLAGRLTVVPASGARSLRFPLPFPAIIDTGGGEAPIGRPSAEGGRAAGLAVEIAASLAKRGEVECIVTGPVSKEALQLGGYRYKGHTEMLADLFDSPHCQMMMVAGKLRIVILTRHIPVCEIAGAVTGELIARGVKEAEGALRGLWGVTRPRIAVAALNPHAGDGGVIGREETDVIIPALAGLRDEGYDVSGPFPADSMFQGWEKKGYDVYVALYHDQGMIPFKMIGFRLGVNMTIGLPVVRTSVSHGTAYDIAGRGMANPNSLAGAAALAVQCGIARRRNIEV